MKKIAAFIIHLKPWAVYEFPWGTAVKDERRGKWTNVFFHPDAQEINVEHINVILHNNGIEFGK